MTKLLSALAMYRTQRASQPTPTTPPPTSMVLYYRDGRARVLSAEELQRLREQIAARRNPDGGPAA